VAEDRPYKDIAFTMPCGWVVVYTTQFDDDGQPIASTLAEVEIDRAHHSPSNPTHDGAACMKAMQERQRG